MKQKLLCILLTAVTAVTLTACGSSKNSSTVFSNEDYGTVTLCDYKNLSAEKNIYTVTEDEIQSEIQIMLYDYAEYKELNGPSENGDSIIVNLTAIKEGENYLDYTGDDTYEIYLGSGEFGNQFDEKLMGASVGDELSFSISYDKNDMLTELAGTTVDYSVKILGITREILPELTDEFITDTLGYKSKKSLEDKVRADLESENESNSSYELRENLLQQVIDHSTFDSYSQDLYDSYYTGMEANYESYMEMFQCESVQDVYDLFGITEKDIEKDVINQVYRTITVHAISETEKLALSDQEYRDGLERYTKETGCETSDDLIAEYGEDSLHEWILEDKVLDFLEKHAKVTEKEAVFSTEEIEFE